MPANRFITFLGALAIIGILFFVAMKGRDMALYNNCLRTWTSDWKLMISDRYGLTIQDLCKKGYTLPQFVAFEENITQRILRSKYFLEADDKYIQEELRRIVRTSIIEDQQENQ